MSPPTTDGASSGPPEVPDEFAAAYWAAYEQAMAAQSMRTPGEHASRRERARDSGAMSRPTESMAPEAVREAPLGDPGPWERLRDSGWFVPLLLVALFMILVLGAYVMGRLLAGSLADDHGSTPVTSGAVSTWAVSSAP